MAARRGTSEDHRSPARAHASTPACDTALGRATRRCVALVPALAATLVACRPAESDPHRELPGSSSTAASTGPADADTTAAPGTTFFALDDTGPQRPGFPAPDCTILLLPGPPSDVAASPRPDHDAEVLALSIDPTRTAAPQARYDVITGDLAAIRALDRTLAEVHVGCVVANGLAFSFLDAQDVNDALFADDYHAWDCHNAYFHLRRVQRIDDLTVAIELDGVFGEAMVQAYASIPGLDDHAPHWFPRDDWPVPAEPGSGCAPVAGSITLTATLQPDGALDQRDYRFDRADGSSVSYRVTPTEPPQLLR